MHVCECRDMISIFSVSQKIREHRNLSHIVELGCDMRYCFCLKKSIQLDYLPSLRSSGRIWSASSLSLFLISVSCTAFAGLTLVGDVKELPGNLPLLQGG